MAAPEKVKATSRLSAEQDDVRQPADHDGSGERNQTSNLQKRNRHRPGMAPEAVCLFFCQSLDPARTYGLCQYRVVLLRLVGVGESE